MSKENLTLICNQILNEFNKKTRRKELEKLNGQLYIFSPKLFRKEIIEFLKKLEYKGSIKSVKALIKRALKAHNDYINANSLIKTEEIQNLENKVRLDPRVIKDKSIIITYIKNYYIAVEAKRQSAISLSNNFRSQEKIRLALEFSGSGDKVQGLQVGHGDFGIAVSNVKAYAAQDIIEKNLDRLSSEEQIVLEEWNSKIIEYLDEFNIIAELHKNLVVNNGMILANFTPIISLQTKKGNLKDAKKEASLLGQLKEYFQTYIEKNYLKIQGSDDIETAFKKVVVTNFLKVKKNSRVKTSSKLEKKTQIKEKSKSGKVKTSIQRKKAINSTLSSGIDTGKSSQTIKPPQHKKQVSTLNLTALKAQINARLSMTVIKNMGTPALENRTGRFARSVQVTDVIQTAKGFPSIGYDYQKYPYQTFEPGYAQGSAQRDPRTLIDRSIREIASELIVGRFYTRRV